MSPRFVWLIALLPTLVWTSGCASLTNPVADGIPVRWVPDEVLARPRSELKPIPLNLLRQKEPDAYHVDKGDLLGIYIEDVLQPRGQPIPIQFNPNPSAARPAIQGTPVTVQDDGTIIIPYISPINVRGMTLLEVRAALAEAVTVKHKLIQPGKEKILVDLIQPRKYRVMVVREDDQSPPLTTSSNGFGGVAGSYRKGSGTTVELEAYRNDLLEALNRTGGPPGLDARNEVVIRRGQYDPKDPSKGYVRIPLRANPQDPLTFTEKDIILQDGDTVYIEARDTEVYYTAGLLGGAQIRLPRDYDLHVVEAITQVRGPLINGSFNQNAFVASAVNTGIGNPTPSLVTVVRHLSNGQIIPIRVDLNRAFRDQRENIIIMPGDYVVLQERPSEAIARYFTQTFRLSTTFTPVNNGSMSQSATSSNP